MLHKLLSIKKKKKIRKKRQSVFLCSSKADVDQPSTTELPKQSTCLHMLYFMLISPVLPNSQNNPLVCTWCILCWSAQYYQTPKTIHLFAHVVFYVDQPSTTKLPKQSTCLHMLYLKALPHQERVLTPINNVISTSIVPQWLSSNNISFTCMYRREGAWPGKPT